MLIKNQNVSRTGITLGGRIHRELILSNVFFNDAPNTFYLRLYGIEHIINDHSDNERKPTAC